MQSSRTEDKCEKFTRPASTRISYIVPCLTNLYNQLAVNKVDLMGREELEQQINPEYRILEKNNLLVII